MVASGLCFVGVTAGVKYLGPGIPAPQSAFLRYALGLVYVLPVLGLLRRTRLEPKVWRAFAWRGVAHTLAVMLWFYAMTRIPLAEVSAMGYMNPIWISIGAALFLGERLRLRRIVAIGVAIAGALVILRPGLRELNSGHLAMLGTSLFFAFSYLTAKRLSGRVSPVVIVTLLSLSVTIGLAPFALAVWAPVTWVQIATLFGIATFATAGHYMMTYAFAAAPITVTQPVTALQLVWSVALGAAFFGEPVDLWVIVGGTMVVSAVIFIALREQQLRRAAKGGTLSA
ncbi:MAG: DMT family transporter [Rhodobacteraceae bacterium]|nr:DMT family transporter [Paracoccaceae bacterium]